MTKDDAIKELESYQHVIQTLFALVALESMRFGVVATDIEPALGMPTGTLFKALTDVNLLSTVSAYTAVLENAAKGQLTVEADDFFTRENVISE